MANSFALARYRARLLPASDPPARPRKRTPEERAQLLMQARTMDEIRHAARLLGLTFTEAYRERQGLYDERWLT